MIWQRGRAEIEQLIHGGELDRVPVSMEMARHLLADASAHVTLADSGSSSDPAGALQLGYDAARKSAAALLIAQGLRSTVHGGHIAVIDAVKAQFNNHGGMQVFGRLHHLRRRRNRSEYPDQLSASATERDALQAISVAKQAINAAQQIMDSGRLDKFV